MLAQLCLTSGTSRTELLHSFLSSGEITELDYNNMAQWKEVGWAKLIQQCDEDNANKKIGAADDSHGSMIDDAPLKKRGEATKALDKAKQLTSDANANKTARIYAYLFLRSQDIKLANFASSIMPLFVDTEDQDVLAVLISDPFLPENWLEFVSETTTLVTILLALSSQEKNLPRLAEQLARIPNKNGSDEKFDVLFLSHRLVLLTEEQTTEKNSLVEKAFTAFASFKTSYGQDKANEVFELFLAPTLLAHPEHLHYALPYYEQASETFKSDSKVKTLMQLQSFFYPNIEKMHESKISDISDSETFCALLTSYYSDKLIEMTKELNDEISIFSKGGKTEKDLVEYASSLSDNVFKQCPGQIIGLNKNICFVKFSLSCRILTNNIEQDSAMNTAGRRVASWTSNKGKPVGKEVKTPFLLWVLNNLDALSNTTATHHFSESMIWKSYIDCYIPIKHPDEIKNTQKKSNNYPNDTKKEKVNAWLSTILESKITNNTVTTLAPLPENILRALFNGTNVAIDIFKSEKEDVNNTLAEQRKTIHNQEARKSSSFSSVLSMFTPTYNETNQAEFTSKPTATGSHKR